MSEEHEYNQLRNEHNQLRNERHEGDYRRCPEHFVDSVVDGCMTTEEFQQKEEEHRVYCEGMDQRVSGANIRAHADD